MSQTIATDRDRARRLRTAVMLVVLSLAGLVSVGAPSRQAESKPARALTNLSLVSSANGLTAIVEANGVIDHRVYALEEPLQVVVDILDVRNELGDLQPKETSSLLERVRSLELSMTAYDREARGRTLARLIFDLKQPVWHSLRVDPGRVELGLHPKGPMPESNPASATPSSEEVSPEPIETASEEASSDPVELEPISDIVSDPPSTEDELASFPAEHWIEPADVPAEVFFGARPSGPGQYQVGPEDQIEIRVFELEQLNRTVRVEADGTVILPLVGPVRVSGLTAPQVAEAVAKQLQGGFVDDPQVTVLITDHQSRRVSLLGAITKPGTYPLVGQRKLLEVLATAEGLGTGAGSVLYVFRNLPDGRSARLSVPLQELLVKGDPRWNIRLEPADIVSVPPEAAVSISVVGAVGRPGVYKLPAGTGATLLRAIAQAGGLKDRASKDVQVQRRSPSGEEAVLKVDLGGIMSGKRPDFVLQEGDVVIVKQSFF